MLLFYVRHGEPIYTPDQLTPLGHRQAKAVGDWLTRFNIDQIYASTSNRAMQTAQPLADLLQKEITPVDWANEAYTWGEFTLETPAGRQWLFSTEALKRRFTEPDVLALGHRWYDHPTFADYDYGKAVNRVYNDVDAFFGSLGYEHERYTGRYKVIRPNNDQVALFAHQGFGFAFLSSVLDIPYSQMVVHFDMGHSAVTIIDFKEDGGYAIPKIVTLASEAHLYTGGLR